MKDNGILLSVCCITYNQIKFIEECIEGILIQKTDFPFEILIHDDASTDGTQAMLKSYAKENPSIKVIQQTENQYSKGINPFFEYLIPKTKGKYIAICEGDDYWTDSFKLQKQVDFLEQHDNYSLTCSGFRSNLNGEFKTIVRTGLVAAAQETEKGFTFTLEDLPKGWMTKTLTALFRNEQEVFKEISDYKYLRDVHLFYHLLKQGNGYYFKEIFGVYNIHEGGVHSLTSELIRKEEAYLYYKEIYEKNREEVSRKLCFSHTIGLLRVIKTNKERVSSQNSRKLFKESFLLVRNWKEMARLLSRLFPKNKEN